MLLNDHPEAGAEIDTGLDADIVDALRAGTWTMLGRLLMASPAPETLQRLIAAGASELGSADPLAAAWAQLREAALAAVPEAIEREYQNVFIGVGGGEVTPYASWYLSGTLFDRPLVELREDLEALGVVRGEGCSEPEDHAGAICETMGLVILDEDVDLDWQTELFKRHAESWMGRFFEDLQKAPSANFYCSVGALGQAFLELERRFHAMAA